ncbi:hypothetical protein N0V90_009788 [Kalmusia sp. IMI 367209]|nr:hypothetical protein N0V90_009788 [Kalmusia sp. IMI 367209]
MSATHIPAIHLNFQLQSNAKRSQSSEYFLEIKKSPAKEPRSRKTDWSTIRTEATDTEPAFESDAFAIQMPTTREPVLDAPIFRAKIPVPSKAQVDAYQTYKQKAQEVRERNKDEGVRVPSKIISYDYAYTSKKEQPVPLELDLHPPASPPQSSLAGSFPISPPIVQNTWTAAPPPRKQHTFPSAHDQSPRSNTKSSSISITEKTVGLGSTTSTSHTRFQRSDAGTGARASPVSTSPRIKVRLVPKANTAQPDPPQKESWWALYNRSPQSSSDSTRSPSPTKSFPRFANTTSASENVAATKDSIFGYSTASITGTDAAKARPDLGPKAKKKNEPKRTLTSRWAWLRPAGPRVAKPTTANVTMPAATAAAVAAAKPLSAYIDPFIQHATPPPSIPATSRPASPRKVARPTAAPTPTAKGKFETGFAQITGFFSLVLKICLLVYALIAIYFVLDAIREAVHAVGAPFRGVKLVGGYVWVGFVVLGLLGKAWERWGIKVALKGGWREKWVEIV